MARIAGIDLPREKRIEIGLTYIYGIGRTSANKILAEAGINPDTRVKDLTEEDEAKLREVIGASPLTRCLLLRAIRTEDLSDLLSICLSDAISRKAKYRTVTSIVRQPRAFYLDLTSSSIKPYSFASSAVI